MTTARQIKKLVTPLLERNRDLVLAGKWIFLKPAYHVSRSILIDRTGNAEFFRSRWALAPLCELRELYGVQWGEFIYPPTGMLGWNWDDARMPAAFCERVEQSILPLLRPINTLDDFIAFLTEERFPSTHFGFYDLSRAVVDVARGDFSSALSICKKVASGNSHFAMSVFDEERGRILNELYPLLIANDRAGLARLLHNWEETTVRNLKLEKVWAPSPFPFELDMPGN